MTHEITFDEDGDRAVIRTAGELDVEGHRLLLRELVADPRWRAGMNLFVDHRAASLTAATVHDVQMVSLLVRQLKGYLGSGGRCAIVLSDSSEFTKVAMWKVLTQPEVGFAIEFFDSIGAARTWLSGKPLGAGS